MSALAIKTRILFALKLAVTVLLCVVILWNADWIALTQTFRKVDVLLLLVVFVCMVLCVTLSAYKWQSLLKIHDAEFGFNKLHKYYFIAMFFNNFLPTSIGGDGYRIYKTLDNDRSRTSAVVAVLMERISGILSLMCIGYLGGIAGYLLHGNPLSKYVVYIGSVGLALSIPIVFLLHHGKLLQRLKHWKRFPAALRKVTGLLGDYSRKPIQSFWIVIISFVFHAFSLFWMLTLIHAVGGSMSVFDLAVVSALLSVIAIVPLSINGIGLVDGSFIYLAGQFGLGYEIALMVMLLHRALLIPISLVGGIFYALTRRDAPDKEVVQVDGLSSTKGSY
ncbi:MAG: flippase-like domain-containing protein [Gammaproteobacteria bacterium]|nr:flippase-like domain-containing protein [Gammaproteobacteria bacterium]